MASLNGTCCVSILGCSDRRVHDHSNRNRSQAKFKEELAEIGLIHRRKSNSRRFYVTSSALQLVTYNGSGGGDRTDGPDLPIKSGNLGSAFGGEAWSLIVESNFKVYAYTNSKHVVLLLNLFIRVEYLL